MVKKIKSFFLNKFLNGKPKCYLIDNNVIDENNDIDE